MTAAPYPNRRDRIIGGEALLAPRPTGQGSAGPDCLQPRKYVVAGEQKHLRKNIIMRCLQVFN